MPPTQREGEGIKLARCSCADRLANAIGNPSGSMQTAEFDSFAFALRGWHDKSRAFGFQFLVGPFHVFYVNPIEQVPAYLSPSPLVAGSGASPPPCKARVVAPVRTRSNPEIQTSRGFPGWSRLERNGASHV